MVNKKDLVIVAMMTFCLTATISMISSTRSYLSSGTYDAWMDVNEDGRVDIIDAIQLAATFGGVGDPTKNVNVTNWPPSQDLNVTVNLPQTDGLKLSEYDMFLYVDTIPGDSEDSHHRGWIDVLSYNHRMNLSAGVGGAGHPVHEDFVITKRVDIASVKLIENLHERTPDIGEVRLEVVPRNGTAFMRYALLGVSVLSYMYSGSTSEGDTRPIEVVCFGYERIMWEYIGPHGTVRWGWDLGAMRSLP